MKRLSGAIPEHIAQRAAALRALDAALGECLPPECAAHCRAAGIADGTVHLVADSPAWRARLHFYSPQIIKQISGLSKSPVSRVSIRVGAPEAPGPIRKDAPGDRGLPPEAARGLASLADETGDPGLRDVLQRLSRHVRTR